MKIKAYSFKTKRWSLRKIDYLTKPTYEFDLYRWEDGKWQYCGYSYDKERIVKEFPGAYRKYTYVGDLCVKMTGIISNE